VAGAEGTEGCDFLSELLKAEKKPMAEKQRTIPISKGEMNNACLVNFFTNKV
jgi:hypothetical protein